MRKRSFRALLTVLVIVVLAMVLPASASAMVAVPSEIPGAPTVTSPVSASLSPGTPAVWRFYLSEGQTFAATASYPLGSSVTLRLFSPAATSVSETSTVVATAWSSGADSSRDIFFIAPASGTYYLAVNAATLLLCQVNYWTPTQQTSISGSAPTVCAYGATVAFDGQLTDAISEAGLGSRLVYLPSGAPVGGAGAVFKWTNALDGSFELTAAPLVTTTYRVFFNGDHTYAGTARTFTVSPRASLGTPVVPSSPRHGSSFTAYGDLKPWHSAGAYGATLTLQRLRSGKWVSAGSVKAKASNWGAYSRYKATLKLAYAGKWRVMATHADASHAKTTTGWKYFTMK